MWKQSLSSKHIEEKVEVKGKSKKDDKEKKISKTPAVVS